MTPATSFAGRKVLVFGLGGSGTATAEALRAGGAEVLVADDGPARVADLGQRGFATPDLHGLRFQDLAALILSPGVPLTHPSPHWVVGRARAAGVPIIGDIELFVRERRLRAPDAPFVAITGTNGKSTTTALIGHLLAASGHVVELGGNIGTPVLSLAPPDPARVHVLELSSFQIDLTPTLDPGLGVLLNVSADHLDRHGTLDAYAALKERLIMGVQPKGTAVVGVDDRITQAVADRADQAGIATVRISAKYPVAEGVYARGSQLVRVRNGSSVVLATLTGIGSLRGQHNAQNAAAASAAVLALGVAPEAIARALQTFPGLKHRMEEVGRRGRVLFVNDSKATNADAAARALSSFETIFWIAGGRPKAGGITGLGSFFPRIRKAYLVGEAAEEFAATLAHRVPHVVAGTLDRAVELAAADAALSEAAEPVVLLSPACASYDQFPNFEVRGDAFRDIVARLP